VPAGISHAGTITGLQVMVRPDGTIEVSATSAYRFADTDSTMSTPPTNGQRVRIMTRLWNVSTSRVKGRQKTYPVCTDKESVKSLSVAAMSSAWAEQALHSWRGRHRPNHAVSSNSAGTRPLHYCGSIFASPSITRHSSISRLMVAAISCDVPVSNCIPGNPANRSRNAGCCTMAVIS